MLRIAGGLFMGWSLGANDAANIFGTGVTSRLIRFRTAVTLIAVFVIIGAVLEGSKCMDSIKNLGALDLNQAFICTLAAAITMTLMTFLEIPSSTSQAIVGAIMGSAIISHTANFNQFFKMLACWVLTPVGGAIIGYFLYLITDFFVRRYVRSAPAFQRFLQIALILSGCYGSYALGANNVANTTGVYVSTGLIDAQTAALLGGISIAVGAITFSKKVMFTVGSKITLIGPIGAVIATLSHSITIHIFTQIGIPVSSSQAIVGAVIGIGLVRGMRAVNRGTIVKIVIGWITTPVMAGLLAWSAVMIYNYWV